MILSKGTSLKGKDKKRQLKMLGCLSVAKEAFSKVFTRPTVIGSRDSYFV